MQCGSLSNPVSAEVSCFSLALLLSSHGLQQDTILTLSNSSHANVHSQSRPHYCPVGGCPRGEGGKGFKRKNEMIRHGLVHQSPGYVCPFCPDREHKYPRPDNLQRCVHQFSTFGPRKIILTYSPGMFVFITLIRIKMIRNSAKYWHSVRKAEVEGGDEE